MDTPRPDSAPRGQDVDASAPDAGLGRPLLVLVRAGGRLCGWPVTCVDETMRPLPVQRLPDAPDYLRGAAVIRGAPTPIVDLRRLLGEDPDERPTRLVTVRAGPTRKVGLLVDEVLGVRSVPAALELAALFDGAASRHLEGFAIMDDELITVLRAARLVPEATWRQVEDAAENP